MGNKNTQHNCPICGKYSFVQDNSFDICKYCGWEDDEIQTKDPYFWGGANELSLIDYKKNYDEEIKKNPDFYWKRDFDKVNFDKYTDNSHMCPICGKTKFKHEDSHDRCEFCGWIDNWTQEHFPDFNNSSNMLSLTKYKEEYSIKIQEDSSYVWGDKNKYYDFTEEEKEYLASLKINFEVSKIMTLEQKQKLHSILSKDKQNEKVKKSIIEKMEKNKN